MSKRTSYHRSIYMIKMSDAHWAHAERKTSRENKSDNGSDQPTKSDGIPGNEFTNGSDGLVLFSLYVLISILVDTREELYTTIISYRIPIVGPNQIRWKILH